MDATCGDGIRSLPEPCDDGNKAGGDACTSDCTVESGRTCYAADGRRQGRSAPRN